MLLKIVALVTMVGVLCLIMGSCVESLSQEKRVQDRWIHEHRCVVEAWAGRYADIAVYRCADGKLYRSFDIPPREE